MILVAGSANLDFVVRASHIPAPGETVLGRGFETFPGGKGANQAIACARAGGRATQMLLALGNDAFAAPIESSLKTAGVGMHVVRMDDQPTGTAFICVSDDAENAITVAPGANNFLRGEHLPPLEGVTFLLLQLETPIETVTAYAKAARARGVKVVLNAAPARALPSELMSLVDVLIVNEGELAVVARGPQSPGGSEREALNRRAAQILSSNPDSAPNPAPNSAPSRPAIEGFLEKIAIPCVVVTLGNRGCCARAGNEFIMLDAFPIVPVDTTAAGDTFCGVFVASLDGGLPVAAALRQASAAAALACTKPGAQSSIPTQAELQTFLKSHP